MEIAPAKRRRCYWDPKAEQIRLKDGDDYLAHKDTGVWEAEEGVRQELIRPLAMAFPTLGVEAMCMLISNRIRGQELRATEVERA